MIALSRLQGEDPFPSKVGEAQNDPYLGKDRYSAHIVLVPMLARKIKKGLEKNTYSNTDYRCKSHWPTSL
jgi:hypothetical protein